MMKLGMGLNLASGGPTRWWPSDAVYAADFLGRRYMRDGREITAAQAFTFSRASTRLAEDASGNYLEFAVDEPAITNLGLSLEPQRTNLNPRLRHSNSTGWVSNSGATVEPYPGIFAGLFNDAGLVTTAGSAAARRETQTFEVTAGTTYSCTFWYKSGKSGKVRLSCRAGAETSSLWGPSNAPDLKSELAGNIIAPELHLMAAGVYRLSLQWSPPLMSSGARLGIGPNSAISGEDIVAVGCQVEAGTTASSPISSAGAVLTREEDYFYAMLPPSSQRLYLEYPNQTVSIESPDLQAPLPRSNMPIKRIWVDHIMVTRQRLA